jgi:hypothetical protein
MANDFLNAAKRAIDRNGRSLTYRRLTTGAFDINTGGVAVTSTDTSVKMYKRHIRASQFNLPNLIGKEVAEFYIVATDISFVPKVKDKIVDADKVYTVETYQTNEAAGQVILYKVIAVI